MTEQQKRPTSLAHATGLTVDRYFGISDDRRWAEATLLARGILVPLSARVGWLEAFPTARSCLYVVRKSVSDLVGAVTVEEARSRALPGHRIWRVRYVDPSTPPEVSAAAIDAVLRAAETDRCVLRVHFDIFSADPALRGEFATQLQVRSLTRLESTHDHEWTLLLNLTCGIEEIWNSLSSVRRNVRQVKRGPFEVRVIEDESLVPRMAALLKETYARTGGGLQNVDFAGVIRLGKLLPAASHISGLFHKIAPGSESLVAFAWGVRNGSHVTYSIGASSRDSAVRRFPLAYPLLWTLVAWAAAEGAEWFDLGGVTGGTQTSSDRLGGISDFKRHFSREVVNVREEWQYEPHPWRARVAQTLTNGAGVLKEARSRIRSVRIRRATGGNQSASAGLSAGTGEFPHKSADQPTD